MSLRSYVIAANKRFRAEAKSRCYTFKEGFSWWGGPVDRYNWMRFNYSGYGYGLIGEANRVVIEKLMDKYIIQGTATLEYSNGIGEGIYGIAVRVFTEKGNITAAYRYFVENVLEPLERYPVLDDDLFYELEHEDQLRALKEGWDRAMYRLVLDAGELDNETNMYRVFAYVNGGTDHTTGEHFNSHWEDSDGNGWYLDPDLVIEALEYFGLVVEDPEYEGEYKLPDSPTQEELAQIAAQEFQLGLALV